MWPQIISTIVGGVIAIVPNLVITRVNSHNQKTVESRTLRREEYFHALHILHKIDVVLRELPNAMTPTEEAEKGIDDKIVKEHDKLGAKNVDRLFAAKNRLEDELWRIDMVANKKISNAMREYFDTIEEYFRNLLDSRTSPDDGISFIAKDWNDLQQRLKGQQETIIDEMRQDVQID